MKFVTLFIFIICYIFLVISKRQKSLIVWGGNLILIILGIISLFDMSKYINWNVLGIFWGTLIVADLFIYSKVPAYLANVLVSKAKTVSTALLAVCALSGFISAFVENVATVLIVAPIALEIARRLKVSPVPFIIGIAISSNLQGTATLVGDPPSMILAGFAKMNFNDFFIMFNKPGIFFAVQLGAIGAFMVLYIIFRKYNQPIGTMEKTEVLTWAPTVMLTAMVLSLALGSFVAPFIAEPVAVNLAGIICVIFGIWGFIWYFISDKIREKQNVYNFLKGFDWDTFFFLMGLFILVGSLSEAGLITDLTNVIKSITGNEVFLTYTIIVWLSVLLSAFIDNVPYILAMLPVTQMLANGLGISPYLLYFGLLIGASVGGNITPIGASANVVGCGFLKKNGYHVKFGEFVKIGLPFTLVSVMVAYLFIWILYR